MDKSTSKKEVQCYGITVLTEKFYDFVAEFNRNIIDAIELLDEIGAKLSDMTNSVKHVKLDRVEIDEETKQKMSDKFNAIADEEANMKSFMDHYAPFFIGGKLYDTIAKDKEEESLLKHYNGGNGYGMNRRRN